MHNRLRYGIAAIILVVTAFIYWPVVHADFVWDDWPSFHDTPWLTQGDQWKHYIFRDFNSWELYFRPLVVAFLTLQVRLFNSAPGPMHAVSLGLHLINTLLVGTLSWRCGKMMEGNGNRLMWTMAGCMTLFGLHPALIEPVAWIGCQFDLVTTMLVLLGLVANVSIRRDLIRATTLTAIFFLAACSKESAVSLPLLVVITDWVLFARKSNESMPASFRSLLHRNWIAYAGMFLAGIIYLCFRHWALGGIKNPFNSDTPAASFIAHLQEACFVYVRYLRTMVWPIYGMSPIHPLDVQPFTFISVQSILTDILALGIFLPSLYLAIKRASSTACIILAATAALLPVLHVIPLSFERSLYHERYATTALAVVCSLLPLVCWPRTFSIKRLPRRPTVTLFAAGIFLWLAFAIVDIRIILPMWSNDTNLWRWALAVNPQASQAKDNLLHTYIKNKDYSHARELGSQLLADPAPCANCMLMIAKLAVNDKDSTRAEIALERARRSPLLLMDKGMLSTYYVTTGQMLILQGKLDDAENVLRAASSLTPADPLTESTLEEVMSLKRSQPSQSNSTLSN
ncbi:hypothetical protein [Dyella sp. RRB7]|uniref:tetratricopeptide repeat protein n=1 Tax=Dyella sp. RRB7 TaxID=2919502 RepID=UPI001FA9BBB0|nr:hypothetical protein [Dyella sp. RRB7]